MDDDHGEQREEDVESQLPKTHVRVPRIDLAVAIAIPEEAVLLEDRLQRVTNAAHVGQYSLIRSFLITRTWRHV